MVAERMSEPSEGDREPRGYTRPDLPMHGVNDSSNSSRLRRLRPESSCLHSPSPFPLGNSPAIAHDRKWSATVIIAVHTLPTPSDVWPSPSSPLTYIPYPTFTPDVDANHYKLVIRECPSDGLQYVCTMRPKYRTRPGLSRSHHFNFADSEPE